MTFELWDADGGNCIGAHRTELAALRAVARLARHYGRDSREVRALGLIAQEKGRTRLIAEGAELVDRAHTTARRVRVPA